ncbi:MAG: hypothetical protein ABIQ12_02005 [Opitutaceae bacterium]
MISRFLTVALLGCAIPAARIAAQPARVEFASAEIAGRGIHALRLVVDTSGPAREATLEISAPEGTRFVRPAPGQIRLGEGAPAVLVFHLFVTESVLAGDLQVRGLIRDGSVATPILATAVVRSAPGFRVRSTDSDVVVGFDGNPVAIAVAVQNTGNTPLQFNVTAPTGTDGPAVAIAPARFHLSPGGEQKVAVSLRAARRSSFTTEHTVACLFEATANDFKRTEQVIARAVFVPRISDPGPLFATLEGGVEVGAVFADGHRRMATELSLAGEIKPGLMLEVYGLDGVTTALGSQLGLARKDTWHVSLDAPGWHATVGEARAPSLGFLEPAVSGRGIVTGIRKEGWAADTFALRDAFAGSVREAAGVKFAGPGETWEAGALIQRSRERFFVQTQRVGAFAGDHWMWQGIKGRTQIAVAEPAGGGAKFGFAQSIAYQGKHARVDARYEHAAEGFFLRDQSSESRSILAEWSPGGGWTLFGGANQSSQTGRLRTLLEEQNNQGRPADPAAVVELIHQVATRQESVNAGVGRQFSLGTLRSGFKHQKRAGELDLKREFSEDGYELEWTSRASEPWWRLGTTVGRETGDAGSSRFAEYQGAIQWNLSSRTRFEGSVRWTKALSGTRQGFRREGLYGQVATSYRPAKGWSAEVRADGYDYKDFASRAKIGALVRFPLGNHGWSGAMEWTRELGTGGAAVWFVVRAPLSIKMPWRPVKGAVGGRIVDRTSGAGLPNVMVQSGRQRAMTDASGRYQLPAMEPGKHEMRYQVPANWTPADEWPESVHLTAGRRDSLDLAVVKLAGLSGEVVVINTVGQSRVAPAGVLVAEDVAGRRHETLVFRGSFSLSLPPGHYKLNFVSELPEELGRQFEAEVEVGTSGVTPVKLEARERERQLRRTLVPGR